MATAKAKEETKKIYNFGEKKSEVIKGKKIPVEWITPKYNEAKKKAIELLESKEYKDVLEESDFWILVNTYGKEPELKAMYSGLIISHDGCLKINDALEDKLKFNPNCVVIDKDGYNNSLVFIYNCQEQGLYEVGEVSKDNCKNGYPYAMALKRCFDRVVLKNSKIAYSGIYSDSESDEFTKRIEDNVETPKEETPTTPAKKTTTKKEEAKGENIMIQESQVNIIKNLYKDDTEELIGLLKHIGKKKVSELTLLEASSLIKRKETPKEETLIDDDNYLD